MLSGRLDVARESICAIDDTGWNEWAEFPEFGEGKRVPVSVELDDVFCSRIFTLQVRTPRGLTGQTSCTIGVL